MRTLAFLLLSAVAACAASGAGATPGIDVPAKARRVMNALGPAVEASSRAWPGYNFLEKPLLITFSDGTALLIGHPAPPAEFRRIEYQGRTAYVADHFPRLDWTFRLNYEFEGSRVTAVREETELQGTHLLETAVHERFHEFQKGFRSRLAYRDYEVEEGEDVALATLENRALASWLETGDAQALRDFAALRQRRRALFPGTEVETREENLEGTAQFVGMAAKGALDGEAAARDNVLHALRAPLKAKDMDKQRLYAVGAVLGRILESEVPGEWQSGVSSGMSLSELALDGMVLTKAEVATRVAHLTGNREYARLLTKGRRDVEKRRRKREEAMRRFDSRPGRRIVIRKHLPHGGFNDDGDWFRYADGSLLHEHVIAWVGAGKSGQFKLSDMPVLESHREQDRTLEFYAAPGAEVLVDGRPWAPEQEPLKFRDLIVRGRGIEMTLTGGSVESRGGALIVILPDAD